MAFLRSYFRLCGGSLRLDLVLRNTAAGLAAVAGLGACTGHAGQIDARAQVDLTIPESEVTDSDYPLLLTISIGHEGKEEIHSSESEKFTTVLCHAPEGKVIRTSLMKLMNCKIEDFYVRATARQITPDDPSLCDETYENGAPTSETTSNDYSTNQAVLAENRTFAFSQKDCGPQNGEFELQLVAIK